MQLQLTKDANLIKNTTSSLVIRACLWELKLRKREKQTRERNAIFHIISMTKVSTLMRLIKT